MSITTDAGVQLTPNQLVNIYEQRANLTATLKHAIRSKQMRPYLMTFSNSQLQAVCQTAKLPPKSKKEANVEQLAELVENNEIKISRIINLIKNGSIVVLTSLYLGGVLTFPVGTKMDKTDGRRVKMKNPNQEVYDVMLMAIICSVLGASLVSSLKNVHKSFTRLRGKRRIKTIKALHKQIHSLNVTVPKRKSSSRASGRSREHNRTIRALSTYE